MITHKLTRPGKTAVFLSKLRFVCSEVDRQAQAAQLCPPARQAVHRCGRNPAAPSNVAPHAARPPDISPITHSLRRRSDGLPAAARLAAK